MPVEDVIVGDEGEFCSLGILPYWSFTPALNFPGAARKGPA